jgi:hypothetical protein
MLLPIEVFNWLSQIVTILVETVMFCFINSAGFILEKDKEMSDRRKRDERDSGHRKREDREQIRENYVKKRQDNLSLFHCLI